MAESLISASGHVTEITSNHQHSIFNTSLSFQNNPFAARDRKLSSVCACDCEFLCSRHCNRDTAYPLACEVLELQAMLFMRGSP